MLSLKTTLVLLLSLLSYNTYGHRHKIKPPLDLEPETSLEQIYKELEEQTESLSLPIIDLLQQKEFDRAWQLFNQTYNEISNLQFPHSDEVPEKDIFLIYQMFLFFEIKNSKIWNKLNLRTKTIFLQSAAQQEYTLGDYQYFMLKQLKDFLTLEASATTFYILVYPYEFSRSVRKKSFPQLAFERMRKLPWAERVSDYFTENLFSHLSHGINYKENTNFNIRLPVHHKSKKLSFEDRLIDFSQNVKRDLITNYYIAFIVQGYDFTTRESPIEHFNSIHNKGLIQNEYRFNNAKVIYFTNVLSQIESSLRTSTIQCSDQRVIRTRKTF